MSSYQQRDDKAEQRARGLIDLVRRQLPASFPPLRVADAWPLVSLGLIARQVGTVEAIFALRSLDRAADATILGRSLYDHAVTFAWLAADPGEERLGRFQKEDLRRRLQVDDDCRKLTREGIAVEILTPEARTNFERQLSELEELKNLPDLAALAEGADRYWTGKIEALTGPDTTNSYRGLYAVAYRHQSAIAHATVLGLNAVSEDLDGGGKQVQLEERDPEGHGPFGNATMLLGLTVWVASESLGWPDTSEIEAIFAN